jgi:hypothetical protein
MVAVQVREEAVRRLERLWLIIEAKQRRRVLDHPAGPRAPGIAQQARAPHSKP